jgi:ABC-type transport system involved in multi-copper enzyme maturation permease subunit
MIDPLYIKYAVAFLAVFLTAGIIFRLVRQIADLIVAIVLLGACFLAYQQLKSGNLSSWTEVLGTSVFLGATAGLICIPVLPFSSVLAPNSKVQNSIQDNDSVPLVKTGQVSSAETE